MSDRGHRVNNRQSATPSYSAEFKHRLVVAASKPGATLSSVARKYGVGVSTLSTWCKQSRQTAEPLDLIPIALEPTDSSSIAPLKFTANHPKASPERVTDGSLEINLGQATIRVTGLVDPGALRVVLEGLRGC